MLPHDEIKILKISTAASMVAKINAMKANSVKSFDVLCHGTPYSLNFSVKENENCGLVTGLLAKGLLSVYYSSWEDGVYSFSSDARYVSDINFSVFAEDARVQIHGCNTAKGNIPGDTLTEAFSKELFNAGKVKSYVIGHTDKSNPNIKGDQTTIAQQDYRHGGRAIIHNGKTIKTTAKKGYLAHEEILNILPESKK